jgi:hypothetical protein
MFCALGLVFGGTEGVGYRFHVLRSRTHFRRYRGRRVPFSCFALLDSLTEVPRASGPLLMFCAPGLFSAVPRASGPVFMFCALGLVFGGAECIGSRFHVLRALTHFRRYRGCQVPFSCFELPDSFSTVPRASVPFSFFVLPDSFSAVPRAMSPVFMLYAP